MSSPSQPRPADAPHLADDELAAQRRRHTARIPDQRAEVVLTEPDREQYERRLDAYEVQAAEYRERLQQVSAQLDAAHHDGLTGAWLRSAGERLLAQELQRAARTDQPLTIAFVDVDGLKQLNDTAGHAAGDHALVTVARVLLAGLRSYDHVVRWGGDEFLCLLPGVTHEEATRRLRHVQLVLAEGTDGLTVSVGVAERRAGEAPAALVGRADAALYRIRATRRRS